MSILILPDPASGYSDADRARIIASSRKVKKKYTDGFFREINQGYILQYIREEGDERVEVKFPNTSDNFNIIFRDENENQLNGQIKEFTTDEEFKFSVLINQNTLEKLNGRLEEHIFKRPLEVTRYGQSITTGFSFEVPLELYIPLDVSEKYAPVRLYVSVDGEPQLVTRQAIEEVIDNTSNLFHATYNGIDEDRKTSVERLGFVDDTRPNSFIFKFNRTAEGNIRDTYDIEFQKDGFKDVNGNDLKFTIKELTVLSDSVPQQQYITKLFRGAYPSNFENSIDTSNGNVQITDLTVKLHTYNESTNTIGSQVSNKNYSYYIIVDAYNINLDTMVIGNSQKETIAYNRAKFGPFLKDEVVDINMELLDLDEEIADMRLTHYATWEDYENITERSMEDVREIIFDITYRPDNDDNNNETDDEDNNNNNNNNNQEVDDNDNNNENNSSSNDPDNQNQIDETTEDE